MAELKKSLITLENPEEALTAQNITDAKTTLELENVDNTSDADKPVSTAQQTALDLKIEEAPQDGNLYGRQNAQWVQITDNVSAFQDATQAFSIYNLNLPFSNGKIVGVKETGGNTVREFTFTELNNGTTLNSFCGANTGILEYLISQVDGTTKSRIESTDATKPTIYENGRYIKFLKCRAPDNIRVIDNEQLDTANITQIFIGSVLGNTNANFSAITEAGTTLFNIMPNINAETLEVSLFNGSVTEFVTNIESINFRGINVITSGFRTTEAFAKVSDSATATLTTTSLGLDFVDVDLCGRNAGGRDVDVFAWAYFGEGLTDEVLTEKHTLIKSQFKIKEFTLLTNPTLVTPDARSLTGLTYDYDNDEIIVSDYDTESGLRNTNQLKRYNTALDTVLGVIPMPDGALQGIVYYEGLYYTAGGNSLNGYDGAGVLQDTKILPVTAQVAQNNITYHAGSFWLVDTTLSLVEVDAVTLLEVQSIDFSDIFATYGITIGEGIGVNDDYFVFQSGISSGFVFERTTLLKVIEFTCRWGEGIVFDSAGNLYQNRNEGFHDGTVNGNKCFKYSIL